MYPPPPVPPPIPPIATPVIPFLGGGYANPQPHCNSRQVKRLLLGQDLAPFRGDDGTLAEFNAMLAEDLIPEATGRAVRITRCNYDWSKEIWFFDGTGSETLTLPRRAIAYVNAVFLRLLPSMVWYRFTHIRDIDGGAFASIGGVEPAPSLPENIPPTENSNTPYYAPVMYSGAEDADLYFSSRRRTLTIPPRVLAANVASPFWNYSFFSAPMSVEVHFAYGHPPTAYTDGQPLVFDPVTGIMQLTSPPNPPEIGGNAPVDWSSGMPANLTMAVARLAYADILRRLSRGVAGGLSSMSVDGASESYDSRQLGADDEEARAIKALQPFALGML